MSGNHGSFERAADDLLRTALLELAVGRRLVDAVRGQRTGMTGTGGAAVDGARLTATVARLDRLAAALREADRLLPRRPS